MALLKKLSSPFVHFHFCRLLDSKELENRIFLYCFHFDGIQLCLNYMLGPQQTSGDAFYLYVLPSVLRKGHCTERERESPQSSGDKLRVHVCV